MLGYLTLSHNLVWEKGTGIAWVWLERASGRSTRAPAPLQKHRFWLDKEIKFIKYIKRAASRDEYFLEGQWLQKIVSKAACYQRDNCSESRLPMTFTFCGFLHYCEVDTGENLPITEKERMVSTFSELGGKLIEVSQSFTLIGRIIFLNILKTISTQRLPVSSYWSDFGGLPKKLFITCDCLFKSVYLGHWSA